MGLGLLTFDTLDNCRALPCRRLKIRSAALQLCQTSQVWKYPIRPRFMRSLYDLFQSMSNKIVFNKDEAISTELASEPLPPALGWTWLADQKFRETLHLQAVCEAEGHFRANCAGSNGRPMALEMKYFQSCQAVGTLFCCLLHSRYAHHGLRMKHSWISEIQNKKPKHVLLSGFNSKRYVIG